MDEQQVQQHLSGIQTRWTLVFGAHAADQGTAAAAQRALLQRYCAAVYRYLLGALRDANAADEVAQEFALRFVRGDFKRADPGRGRFRDFVKTALYHLIVDYHRSRRGQPSALPDDSNVLPAAPAGEADLDRDFLDRWREELFNRTWDELAAEEERSGAPYFTLLRWRTEAPKAATAGLAARLEERYGRPYTEANARQLLHRARDRFARLLLEEVARSLETDDPDRLEEELIDLGLHAYCGSTLARSRRRG